MAKNFSRYTMRANMLRKVLIRIDYDGVTDINEWIKLFKENRDLSSYFQKYTKGGENGAFPPTRNGCIHSLSMREMG